MHNPETKPALSLVTPAPTVRADLMAAILSDIAGGLMGARDLLAKCPAMTLEASGALAMIERAGALADEAIRACGSVGIAGSTRDWLCGSVAAQALSTIEAEREANHG